MRISADEIFPWITSFEKIKPVLKDLPSVKGTIVVSSITMQGPLYQKKDWKFLVNGELKKFTLDATFLPGKAEETSGMFTITQDELNLKAIRIHHCMVKGTMDTSPAWFSVDMDIASEGFDWETVEKIVRGTKNAKDSKNSKEAGFLENFPLKGTLRLQLDSFKYRQFKWEPLHADVSFDGETMRIRSKKAALCGISTTGDVDITPEGVEIDIALSAKNLQLQPTILCISDKKADITGRFEMTAPPRETRISPLWIFTFRTSAAGV